MAVDSGPQRKIQLTITAVTAVVASIGVLVTLIFTTLSDIVNKTHDLQQQLRDHPGVSPEQLNRAVDGLSSDITDVGDSIPTEIPAPNVTVTAPKNTKTTQVIVKPASPANSIQPVSTPKPTPIPTPTPTPGLLNSLFPPKR